MTSEILQILKQYWGYDSFRGSQEKVINATLEGKDSLALLPTGGGKSICFQVPVLAKGGIGIVISPLIALMNDQVKNLKEKNIPAVAINSTLSYREIDLLLENAANGKYKFLYLSPERLGNDLVKERIKRMEVSLIAIDEAHCISQWGYDFRPSYLEISTFRELCPDVPILALTATATPKVVDDIQEKLSFKKKNAIRQSFFRSNLHYNVLKTERKWAKTLEIFKQINGSGLVYSRNRKNTVEIANWLQKSGVSADYYHAGLKNEERIEKQENWVNNKTRIMVCTNAFGMGIDKPDVRIVVHLELPDSLESYFQEAGRAGRDGNNSYSIVIVDPSDIGILKNRYLENFPDLKFIRRIYQALGNFLQLAIGSGENQSFSFDIGKFCNQYDLSVLKTFNSLKILEREGFLILNDGFSQPSRIYFKADRTSIYDFQLRNPKMDALIKVLFRSYGGLDLDYTSINEWLIAKRLKSSIEMVKKGLLQLQNQGILDYIPTKDGAQLSLIHSRQKAEYVTISDKNLKNRFEDLTRRIKAVQNFVEVDNVCRSRILLNYFGELENQNCGHCDVCRRNRDGNNDLNTISKRIQDTLSKGPMNLHDLAQHIAIPEQELAEILRSMLDSAIIEEENGQIILLG